MKSLISSLSLLLLFSLLLFSDNNFAQNEQKQNLLWVQYERALPSKVSEYEEAQKNANELFKKYMPSKQLYAYSSEDNTYYYFMEIENLDDITKIINEIGTKASKDELQKLFAAFRDKVFSSEGEIYASDKEFSYEPKEPRIKPDEVKFERWTFIELNPYYDQDAFNAFKKEMKEFFEKNKISGGYEFYNKVFGGNSNICVLTEHGKSKIDYLTYSNEWYKTYWKDFEPLHNKFMNFVKDYKVIDCWYRPDLSVIKENKK
jgi:hypothetical protein